jgi:hypothetical protein
MFLVQRPTHVEDIRVDFCTAKEWHHVLVFQLVKMVPGGKWYVTRVAIQYLNLETVHTHVFA